MRLVATLNADVKGRRGRRGLCAWRQRFRKVAELAAE